MVPDLSRRLARVVNSLSEKYYSYIVDNYVNINQFKDLPKDLQNEIIKIENKLKKQ